MAIYNILFLHLSVKIKNKDVSLLSKKYEICTCVTTPQEEKTSGFCLFFFTLNMIKIVSFVDYVALVELKFTRQRFL